LPILYEEYSFAPAKTKDSEFDLAIEVEVFKCPVCGEDITNLEAHMKERHLLRWYFWYAPYGKPLLAFTGVSAVGLVVVGLNKAFPPTPRR